MFQSEPSNPNTPPPKCQGHFCASCWGDVNGVAPGERRGAPSALLLKKKVLFFAGSWGRFVMVPIGHPKIFTSPLVTGKIWLDPKIQDPTWEWPDGRVIFHTMGCVGPSQHAQMICGAHAKCRRRLLLHWLCRWCWCGGHATPQTVLGSSWHVGAVESSSHSKKKVK